MSGIFEEKRLIGLLHEFDKNLALGYLQRNEKFNNALENANLIGCIIPIKDSSLIYPIAFRLEFSEPIFIMLSHPLCRMHAKVAYPIEFKWERFYVTQLGMLPVFFIDLNAITLIKFWSEAAQQISPKALKTILGKEATCMELRPVNRNIPYSTMNFLVAFGANLWKTRGTADEIMCNYLKYSYWEIPKSEFSFSTHLLHTRSSIKYVVKVTKSLCLIDKIGDPANLWILNRKIKAHKIRIQILTEKEDAFPFIKREVYVPDDILEELLSVFERDKISFKEYFLNAVVLEIKEKTNTFELLSIISDIGSSYFELVKTMTAYILMKIFCSTDKISYVCDIDHLIAALNCLITQIGKYLRLPPTLSERIEGIFDFAFNSLYPLFTLRNGKIYFLHPMVFSYLQTKPQFDFLFQDEGREKLGKFLEFLEKLDSKISFQQKYFDETLDMFLGQSKEEVLSRLYGMIRRIKIAKLFQSCF